MRLGTPVAQLQHLKKGRKPWAYGKKSATWTFLITALKRVLKNRSSTIHNLRVLCHVIPPYRYLSRESRIVAVCATGCSTDTRFLTVHHKTLSSHTTAYNSVECHFHLVRPPIQFRPTVSRHARPQFGLCASGKSVLHYFRPTVGLRLLSFYGNVFYGNVAYASGAAVHDSVKTFYQIISFPYTFTSLQLKKRNIEWTSAA